MKQYHAHIYFDLGQTIEAQKLLLESQELVGTKLRLSKWFGKPVGPHPYPMIEIQFDETKRDEIEEWLLHHRGTLSVLIHQDTGDDYKDHSEGITWLGSPVKIDFEFFNLVLSKPELRVHPVKS